MKLLTLKQPHISCPKSSKKLMQNIANELGLNVRYKTKTKKSIIEEGFTDPNGNSGFMKIGTNKYEQEYFIASKFNKNPVINLFNRLFKNDNIEFNSSYYSAKETLESLKQCHNHIK